MDGSRRRALFTCHPLNPHVRPHAPLIKALETLGFEVRLAAPASMEPRAHALGLQHITAGRDWSQDAAFRGRVARLLLEQGNDAFNEAWFTNLAKGARQMAPDVLEIAENWRPDVIVTDISEFGGYLAGEKLGIPVITSDNGLARLVHDLHEPVIQPILNEVRQELGMGPEPEDVPGSYKTILTPAPKELLLPDLELPGLVPFRHRNPRRVDPQLPEGVFESDQTKVVAFFGHSGADYPEWAPIFERSNHNAIRALTGTDYEGLVVVGRGNVAKYADFQGSEAELEGRAVPAREAPNVWVVAETDLPLAFEEADAAFVHGGFGSLREWLEAKRDGEQKLPACVMPNQTDQPSNARILAANGLALSQDPRTATPADVRARLDELIDRRDEFSARIAEIQQRVAELPSVPEIAEAVEHALEIGDLEFRTLKPESDPGTDGPAPSGPRPDDPITITGPGAAALTEPAEPEAIRETEVAEEPTEPKPEVEEPTEPESEAEVEEPAEPEPEPETDVAEDPAEPEEDRAEPEATPAAEVGDEPASLRDELVELEEQPGEPEVRAVTKVADQPDEPDDAPETEVAEELVAVEVTPERETAPEPDEPEDLDFDDFDCP